MTKMVFLIQQFFLSEWNLSVNALLSTRQTKNLIPAIEKSMPSIILVCSLDIIYYFMIFDIFQAVSSISIKYLPPIVANEKGQIATKYCQNPNPNPNTNLNTTVGFDMKMTVQTTPPHTNFSATSRPTRELKFGTDTHLINLIKIT